MSLSPNTLDVKQLLAQAIDLHRRGQLDSAKILYEQILAKQHKNFDALHLLGIIHAMQQRLDQAIDLFNKAIKINPSHSAALFNRGNAYFEANQFLNALADAQKVVLLDTKNSNAYFLAGNCLKQLQRFDEALSFYDKALALQPHFAKALNNRGNTLHELARYDDAVVDYKAALALEPGNIAGYKNCGNTLIEAKRLDEALVFYKKTLELDPQYQQILGHYLHLKSRMCDWSNHAEELQQLIQAIDDGKNVTTPFSCLSLVDDPRLHQKAATIYTQSKHPANNSLRQISQGPRNSKIRVGYFSADFNDHAVSCLMVELFELHDRTKFEIIAISLSPSDHSAMRERVENSFDQFIDVNGKSDLDIALLARSLHLDIAIDLGGHTMNNRLGIFSYRVAPVQMSYIGYLGTLGADYFDYLIADPIMVASEHQQFYNEKILYLPSYQVNDSRRATPVQKFTRQDLKLPEHGFVFCCFNNSYKIQPATFESWMRILQQVEGSVLFLYADNSWVESNLKNQAQKLGVDPQRLVFGERLNREDYVSRFLNCDLFLDTLPYNAGTTASDALWAGLPLITCLGKSFAGRMAASLLHALDLDELVAPDPAAYEALAVELAKHPTQLKAVRDKLSNNRLTQPLFNTPEFARHLEAAFVRVVNLQ